MTESLELLTFEKLHINFCTNPLGFSFSETSEVSFQMSCLIIRRFPVGNYSSVDLWKIA